MLKRVLLLMTLVGGCSDIDGPSASRAGATRATEPAQAQKGDEWGEDGDGDWDADWADPHPDAVRPARLRAPKRGSRLADWTVSFDWDDAGAEAYWLFVGSWPGGNDLLDVGTGTASAAEVLLPKRDGVFYVRLWSWIGGA